jgi:hypothetical protein
LLPLLGEEYLYPAGRANNSKEQRFATAERQFLDRGKVLDPNVFPKKRATHAGGVMVKYASR